MKATVLGSIVFLAVAVLVMKPWKPDSPSGAFAEPESTGAGIANIEPSQTVSLEPVHHSVEERNVGASPQVPEPTDEQPGLPDGAKAAAEDWDAPCECREEWQRRRQEQMNAIHKAEPKDVNWAFETEQILEQYLATHSLAGKISHFTADCRTGYCNLTATVKHGSEIDFYTVFRNAADEQWSTFGAPVGRPSEAIDDGLQVKVVIGRRPDSARWNASEILARYADLPAIEGCECATPEWQWRKAEYEKAIREAEEKDPYWAYAQEARIAQSIAEHPDAPAFVIDSIDCRSTYCKISGTCIAPEEAQTFMTILQSAASQPGWDMEGNGSVTVDGAEGIQQMTAYLKRYRMPVPER